MRPRERYTVEGPGRFGDDELLALILGTGTADRAAIEIARDLLARFDGPGGLVQAPPGALAGVPGIGEARAVRVHAACALGRRARLYPPPSRVLAPEDAWDYLHPHVVDRAQEELHALYLARGGRLLACQRLTVGNDCFTIVDPKQVLRPAVALGATGIILAHNHPSGDPTPSEADRDCTRRVAEAGRVVGVVLLDHLVMGRHHFVSLAAAGVLPPWAEPIPPLTGGLGKSNVP